MTFVQRTDWKDLPDTSTPLDATDVLRWEQGIADANAAAGSASTAATNAAATANSAVTTASSAVDTANSALSTANAALTAAQTASVTDAGVANQVNTGSQTQAALKAALGAGSTVWLGAVGASFGFAFTSITTTDIATGLPTDAQVQWPDGTAGHFTGTTDGANGYTGYTVTWVGSTTKTLTVSGISYNANGIGIGPTSLAVS